MHSGLVALIALALTLYDPEHFAAADHWGGFAVGLIVLFTALHVVRDTSNELMDAMPNDERIDRIRSVALSEPGGTGG
jgi:divalent metal cation (Fe/Co/Zn/Cd) transporter